MATRQARTAALLAAFALAGCSSVPNALNPVAWYRDLSGASKNDALDKEGPNQKNFAAGGNQAYPNLASVPGPPGTATSTIDRNALQQSLVADRKNAQYTDEQLRAGLPPPVAAPPPPAPTAAVSPAPATATAPASPAAAKAPHPPAPAAATGAATAAAPQPQAAAATSAESPLKSPTIASLPQGEAPAAPPPPPDLAAPGSGGATASLAPARRPTAGPSEPIAAIAFTGSSTALSDDAVKRLHEIAAMQHAQGGKVRVIGHADETANEAAQQKIAKFTLALSRAKTVAEALSSAGVPSQAIAVEAVPSAGGNGGAGTEIFLEH